MVAKRLNVPTIKQGYGLTETTLAVMNSPDNNTEYKSVGTLVPGIAGKLLKIYFINFIFMNINHLYLWTFFLYLAKVIPINGDKSNKPLGPHNIGELCFKGDLIMKGYCDNEQATAITIDKDGWLHSGDIGYYDEQGYFYIVDRLKELIKYKGFQVPPAELEAILLTCPEIKDAAVIGLPHEEAGELPTAFIVKQKGSNITAEDIIKFVNGKLLII